MIAFRGSRKFTNLTQQQCIDIIYDANLKKLRKLGGETYIELKRNKKKLCLVQEVNSKRTHAKLLDLETQLTTKIKFLHQKIEQIQNEISNNIEKMIYKSNETNSDSE